MEKIESEYKIIIVDDEPIVTSTLKTLLTFEGGYNPLIFNSPFEAIEYINISQVDLVISDFLMPEMNGIEFLAKVKKIRPEATLILLTGYADKESAIKAINEVGLYRYIEKPWNNEDLMLCIKNGLERSHLMESLKKKITELSQANEKLENYNEQLEHIIRERTADLIKSNTELEKINIKLSAIINHCADGIITVSKDGIICQINPAFEKICGLNEQDIIKKDIMDIFSGNTMPVMDRLNPESDVLLRDYKISNAKLGRLIPVEVSFAPVISPENQEVSYYVGVIRDITSQCEMERLREDFIATLTHDLRTPLLAAIQTLRFFQDGSLGKLEEKQSKLLETMLYSNEDMLGLVNALLEVYKYESGQLVLCKTFFSSNDFIFQGIQEVESLLKNKNIELAVNTGNDRQVYADKQELRRVLANLLGNAINHTPSEGKIIINFENNDDEFILSVEDTGIGIPEEDIPKLFNRFSQGTSKKRSTGTGLGLYLSRQIVEAHGGRIWIESKLNKGSKFAFTIPVEKNLAVIKECEEIK